MQGGTGAIISAACRRVLPHFDIAPYWYLVDCAPVLHTDVQVGTAGTNFAQFSLLSCFGKEKFATWRCSVRWQQLLRAS